MKKALSLLSLAAASTFAASAPQTHDGFFLSMAMGLGYQNIDFVFDDYDDETSNLNGLSTDIDVKLGFKVANNLLMHMTLTGATPTDSYSDDGDEHKANIPSSA